MKNIASIALAAALAATTIGVASGCRTLPSGQKTVDTNMVLQAAVIFKSTARFAAAKVMQDKPDTRAWFDLAQAAIGQFVAGADHNPKAFKKALNKLPKLSGEWQTFIVSTVVDAYEIYYLNYAAPVNDKTQAGWVAVTFLTAIQEGFLDALAQAPGAAPPAG
jgi:hypothetical protein